MKYLRLRFQNACLKYDEKGKEYSGHCSLGNIQNSNWYSPIGVDQLSNALHVMFGLPPKPSKRESVFERNEDIYKLACGAYIKYDNYTPSDMNSVKFARNLEFFQTAKPKSDSNSKVSTLIDGTVVTGYYSWDYFKRRFTEKEMYLYDEIINFFSGTLGVSDVRKCYTFVNFVTEFHKHLNDEKVKTFIDNKLCKGGEYYGVGKPLNKPVVTLLTNTYEKAFGSNCDYSQKTPLLYTKGTGRKISFDGEIIVPIPNEEYIDFLSEFGVLPTILDGGMVTIVSITNSVDIEDDNFKPILEEK
jgi:hypothetical protein